MTAPELDRTTAIRERLAAATPGPWVVNQQTCGSEVGEYTVWGVTPSPATWASDDSPAFAYCEGMDQSDAEFIARAPADITWLLGEVERLHDENTRLGNLVTVTNNAIRLDTENVHLRAAVHAVRALNTGDNRRMYGRAFEPGMTKALWLVKNALDAHLPDDTKEA